MESFKLNEVLNNVSGILPNNLFLYNVNGQVVFPIRSPSGGLVAYNVCYLMRVTDHIYYMCLPIKIMNDGANVFNTIINAVSDFSTKAHQVNMDGGDLGLPE